MGRCCLEALTLLGGDLALGLRGGVVGRCCWEVMLGSDVGS